MNRDLRLRPAAGEMGEEVRNSCEDDIAENEDGAATRVQNPWSLNMAGFTSKVGSEFGY